MSENTEARELRAVHTEAEMLEAMASVDPETVDYKQIVTDVLEGVLGTAQTLKFFSSLGLLVGHEESAEGITAVCSDVLTNVMRGFGIDVKPMLDGRRADVETPVASDEAEAGAKQADESAGDGAVIVLVDG